jgi:hypothetical protein
MRPDFDRIPERLTRVLQDFHGRMLPQRHPVPAFRAGLAPKVGKSCPEGQIGSPWEKG